MNTNALNSVGFSPSNRYCLWQWLALAIIFAVSASQGWADYPPALKFGGTQLEPYPGSPGVYAYYEYGEDEDGNPVQTRYIGAYFSTVQAGLSMLTISPDTGNMEMFYYDDVAGVIVEQASGSQYPPATELVNLDGTAWSNGFALYPPAIGYQGVVLLPDPTRAGHFIGNLEYLDENGDPQVGDAVDVQLKLRTLYQAAPLFVINSSYDPVNYDFDGWYDAQTGVFSISQGACPLTAVNADGSPWSP